MKLYKKTFTTNLCDMTVISDDSYIINLCFEKDNYNDFLNKYFKGAKLLPSNELCSICEAEIKEYLSGKDIAFTVPTKLYGTEYQKKVWEAARNIPYGKTVSYSRITQMAGAGGPRAAGQALSKNPIPIIYPCHRIVRSDGTLGGFSGGFELTSIKEKLLKLESEKIIP